uniref:Uncharacterized protein n=1 Tax=Rhizophora mucronata TaxID=61149 RepID=A0A2P2J3D4_RHIMU
MPPPRRRRSAKGPKRKAEEWCLLRRPGQSTRELQSFSSAVSVLRC